MGGGRQPRDGVPRGGRGRHHQLPAHLHHLGPGIDISRVMCDIYTHYLHYLLRARARPTRRSGATRTAPTRWAPAWRSSSAASTTPAPGPGPRLTAGAPTGTSTIRSKPHSIISSQDSKYLSMFRISSCAPSRTCAATAGWRGRGMGPATSVTGASPAQDCDVDSVDIVCR